MNEGCLLDRGDAGAMFIDGPGIQASAHYRQCARSPRRYVTTRDCAGCRHKLRGTDKCRKCGAPILVHTGPHGDLCDGCAVDAIAEETTIRFPIRKEDPCPR